MMRYIKRLKATFEQYKAWEEASFMASKVREETSFEAPKTRTQMLHTQSKGNTKVGDEESSDEVPRDINWNLVRVVQRYQKEQEEDYGLDDASPLSEEILVETFPLKFKLPSLGKHDGMADPRSHLATFRTIRQLLDVNDFVLCQAFP